MKKGFIVKGGAANGGGGDCVRAGAGVSIGDDEDEEVGVGTKRDEVGVYAAPPSSVVGGNDESGDDAIGRLWCATGSR